MENDLQILHEATLTLLKRTGVKLDSPRALEFLSAAGVRVDSAAMRVYPEAGHFEEALATVPRRMTIHGRRPDRDRPVVLGGDCVNVMSGGGSLRVLTVDGCYEPSTWEHLRQFNILLDALPNIHMHINQVDPADHVGTGFYRRLAAEMLTGCTKPLCFQAASGDDVQAMIEMGVEIRGSRAALVEQPLFMMGLNAEPPLHISGGVAEALMATCRAGLPVSMGHYAMMGVTAPVTVAGTVVQINAVQIVAIILAQAVRRGAPICYTSFAAGADLRTLDVSTSTPHALQLLRLGIEMGRFYGLPIYSLVATDARAADPQAACERAVELLIGFEAGAHLLQGPTSSMDRFMLSSFVQAVIDNDIAGYVLAARRRPSVSAETLALEAGHDVATDVQYAQFKFASHMHTVRHLRDEVWAPWAFSSDNFAAWDKAGRVSVVARAAAKAREILTTHRPEPLPASIAGAIRRAFC
jgi:trimethylamine--corrinoid protein Co-methyltransferase